ncbi:hypothetical protein GCM10017784_18800 [Deinococcus indicus]|nr:hypothetical protein GCM10017784_18800 [Deinococcus indicus]
MSGRERAREAVAVETWASWATSWMLGIENDYTSLTDMCSRAVSQTRKPVANDYIEMGSV